MRSSKSRSRSKNSNNRNRSVGNIVNRVFDSSGPEGKVRGTPQQVIEKYNQLARDAQLSNDRVAAENFQQHAEHYTRMLGEAQREIDSRREQLEREHQERQQQNRDEQQNQPQQARDEQQKPRDDKHSRPRRDRRDEHGTAGQPDVIDTDSGQDSGLVETPEESQPKKRAPRARKPKASATDRPDTPEAAE